MEFFFRPRGIAVVGATVKPKGGLAIVLNLIKGFSGGIYPVNPGYDEIAGLPCYARVPDVPDPVDLAIVFVPAPQVPDIVEQCARRGIRGIMIESAGWPFGMYTNQTESTTCSSVAVMVNVTSSPR